MATELGNARFWSSSVPETDVVADRALHRFDGVLRWLGHQRWLRYGLRDRLVRAVRNPERAMRTPFETAFVGFRYPGDLSRWIDWIVFYFGAYELDELELVSKLFADRADAVALDIGANVGHHALFMASFCAQVHAFEPFDGVAHYIDEKIQANATRKIVVHRIGLSDADAELPYFASTGSNIGNGTFVPALADRRGEPHCMLALKQGDDYLALLGLARIDLVKIDVEGFELNVLRGLKETLRSFRPLIMLELSDTARFELGSLDQLLVLLPPDYEVLRIVPPAARYLLFSTGRARLEPIGTEWSTVAARGGYSNLLLRPRLH